MTRESTQGADARALRRCIFCGRDRLRIEDTGRHAWVVCVDCGAEGPALNTAEVAVAAWNRIAAALERLEALEELVRLARNRCCGAHPCADCLPYEKALTLAPATTKGGENGD